jgi:predicted secreted protein
MFLALLVSIVHPATAVVVLLAALVVSQAAKFGGLTIVKWILAILALSAPLFGTTVAYPGYGSSLASGGTSGASYTAIAQLKKFNFGGLKADFDEITNLQSPTIYKEWMKTTVDGADITFDGVLNPTDPTTQSLLTNIGTSGSSALFDWKITTTDGSIFTFQGYVGEFKFGAEYNKAITFSGSIKVVGAITATWS